MLVSITCFWKLGCDCITWNHLGWLGKRVQVYCFCDFLSLKLFQHEQLKTIFYFSRSVVLKEGQFCCTGDVWQCTGDVWQCFQLSQLVQGCDWH